MTGQQSEGPSPERPRLPETITANGVTRWLTRHLRENPDDGVTADRIQYALENWIVRGICTDNAGNVTTTYWAYVPGRDDMLRVPVSLDDAEIITAHFDEHAAGRIVAEDRPWFQRRCRDLEVRDGG